jgi:signal peptidase I
MTESKSKAAVATSGASELRDTIVVIIEALLIALVFRTFLYQPFSIPTGSMQSTLMIGDYVLTSKYSWGYGRYSFPLGLIPFDGRIFGREPNRGDIAVFHVAGKDDPLIKRLIGLPGDHIQVTEGILHINGDPVIREEIGQRTDTNSYGDQTPVTVYRETLPNGVVHTIQEISDSQPLDNTTEYVVPASHYFMMGDNRDNSADSRILSDVGYVPAGNLIGKAEVSFFSLTGNIPPWQIWRWPANVRWDRMFKSVYDF